MRVDYGMRVTVVLGRTYSMACYVYVDKVSTDSCMAATTLKGTIRYAVSNHLEDHVVETAW
jgi:hypothetical protein